MQLKSRPIMPKQETSLSLHEMFRRGDWLSALEYALILEIPISELDQRCRSGHISPLVEVRQKLPRQWEYRLIT